MEIGRIKYLREELEAERLDLMEIEEIRAAYHELCSTSRVLMDDPDNALADNMLDELESAVPEIAWIIYDYVSEHFGVSEADDPSWAINPLAAHIESKLSKKEGK